MCPVDRDASVKIEKKKKKGKVRMTGRRGEDTLGREQRRRVEECRDRRRVEHSRQTEERCKIARRSPPSLDDYTRDINPSYPRVNARWGKGSRIGNCARN